MKLTKQDIKPGLEFELNKIRYKITYLLNDKVYVRTKDVKNIYWTILHVALDLLNNDKNFIVINYNIKPTYTEEL